MRVVLGALLGVVGLTGTAHEHSVAPVRGVVVQRFVAPRCERCAGHRGVTVRTTPGDSVVAVRGGTITFAGQVATKFFVVERISPGVRVTYGWLASIRSGVNVGTPVAAGEVLGTVGESTYLGVRVGVSYVEPLAYLGLWRVRLVGAGRAVVGASTPPR